MLVFRSEISVRGNSSYNYFKKGYRLELQNADGRDAKVPLLCVPADADWALYGSVTDRTFCRNILGHELWRRTGRYAARWPFVEVFLITNGCAGFSARCLPRSFRKQLTLFPESALAQHS